MTKGRRFVLLVPDTGPLITLAAANRLDCLTLPGIDVAVPDFVFFEAIRKTDKLGAAELIEWIREWRGRVFLEPTGEMTNYLDNIESGKGDKKRDRGEQAAAEVLRDFTDRNPDLETLMLYEDADINNSTFIRLPKNAHPVGTADLLNGLERAQLIQSADQILDEAVRHGRPETIRTPRAGQDVVEDLAVQARKGDKQQR